MPQSTNRVRRAPPAGAQALLEPHDPRPRVTVEAVFVHRPHDEPRLVGADRALGGRVDGGLPHVASRQPKFGGAPREHRVDGASEILEVAGLPLAEAGVAVLDRPDRRKVRLPHRDRVAVLINEVFLRRTGDPARRHRMRFRADEQVRDEPRDAVRLRDDVGHLRAAIELARATGVEEHHERNDAEVMVVAIDDLPAALSAHEVHRRIRLVQRAAGDLQVGVAVLAERSTHLAPTPVDLTRDFFRRLHRDQRRLIRAVRVRADGDEAAPVDARIGVTQGRLGREVVGLPRQPQVLVETRRVAGAVERLEALTQHGLLHREARDVHDGLEDAHFFRQCETDVPQPLLAVEVRVETAKIASIETQLPRQAVDRGLLLVRQGGRAQQLSHE